MTSHLQACRDMLVFHGIEPREVLYDGVYAEGYEKFRRDPRGERIILDAEVATEFTPWPNSFPVASFFEHYWAWKRAVV